MSALPIPSRFTIAEYLAFERHSTSKHNYFRGRVIELSGASPKHNGIKDNLIGVLFVRLRGGTCRTYSSDQRITIDSAGHYTYPDIIIQCEPPEFDPLDDHTIVNPTVLIEVLSPSTEQYDRTEKMVSYRLLPSLKEILLVSQSSYRIERFVRRDDGDWTWHIEIEKESDLVISALRISIPFADVYRGQEPE